LAFSLAAGLAQFHRALMSGADALRKHSEQFRNCRTNV
jgi:hypothetical protein